MTQILVDKAVVEQALEALDYLSAVVQRQLTTKAKQEYSLDKSNEAITALREALAEQALSKVTSDEHCKGLGEELHKLAEQEKPLYRKVLREMLDAHEQAKQAEIPEWVDVDDYEEQKQEPVGVVETSNEWGVAGVVVAGTPVGTKLYTRPVRTKDLTPHEITALIREGAADGGWQGFAQRVIAADREKNK